LGYNQELMKEHIQKAFAFDQIAYLDKLIEEALDGKARDHPGDRFEILNNGSDVVIANGIELFILLLDLPATCFQFAYSVGQVPGSPVIGAWMHLMLLHRCIPQQFIDLVIGLITDLLSDKGFPRLEHVSLPRIDTAGKPLMPPCRASQKPKRG